MTRATVAVVLVSLAVCVGGCREEPTIVIKFEPNDMVGAHKAADMSSAAPKPADLAVAVLEKRPLPDKKKGVPAECKAAADCVLEPMECCDCANGGKQHAIAKKLAAASKKARAEKCKARMCTMMLSTDPSCGQHADCVDGQCVMAATKKE
jgi:hypothetical protein